MKYVLIILSTMILTFISISAVFFNSINFIIIDEIEFSTADGDFKFTCMPSKGRDYNMMLRVFEEYKSKNDIVDDLKVYRISSKNYFKVTSWCRYKNIPEWNHEYLHFWKR